MRNTSLFVASTAAPPAPARDQKCPGTALLSTCTVLPRYCFQAVSPCPAMATFSLLLTSVIMKLASFLSVLVATLDSSSRRLRCRM